MTIILGDAPTVSPASRGFIYIPMILTAKTETSRCFDSAGALELYNLISTDKRQQRPTLACGLSLVSAARSRAAGLASVDPWGHCDAEGVCANQYARAAGCVLPDNYAINGNNIETLAAGSASASKTFEALARSPHHAAHMFGENDFFRAQSYCGIAVVEGGKHGWYWSVMIAACVNGS